MNSVLLLIAVCLLFPLISSAPVSHTVPHVSQAPDLNNIFAVWMKEYNKVYQIGAIGVRFTVFTDNYNYINQHNKEAAEGLHTYTLALNEFADWTHEEFLKRRVTGRKAASDDDVNDLPTPVMPRGFQAPESVDWRDKGVVTGVKDQGQCGSCWAFSAVGSMEGAYAYATGNLISQSEQQMVDCVGNGIYDCNTGGDESLAFEWTIKQKGSMSEKDYPYTATDHNKCRFNLSLSVANFSKYTNIRPRQSESQLEAAVATRPTVSVAMDASHRSFQLYSKGIYSDPACKKANSQLDHAVLAVGYGVDNATNNKYWLIKNSWGTNWGLKGYFWMLKDGNGTEANMCGVATDANYIEV